MNPWTAWTTELHELMNWWTAWTDTLHKPLNWRNHWTASADELHEPLNWRSHWTPWTAELHEMNEPLNCMNQWTAWTDELHEPLNWLNCMTSSNDVMLLYYNFALHHNDVMLGMVHGERPYFLASFPGPHSACAYIHICLTFESAQLLCGFKGQVYTYARAGRGLGTRPHSQLGIQLRCVKRGIIFSFHHVSTVSTVTKLFKGSFNDERVGFVWEIQVNSVVSSVLEVCVTMSMTQAYS